MNDLDVAPKIREVTIPSGVCHATFAQKFQDTLVGKVDFSHQSIPAILRRINYNARPHTVMSENEIMTHSLNMTLAFAGCLADSDEYRSRQLAAEICYLRKEGWRLVYSGDLLDSDAMIVDVMKTGSLFCRLILDRHSGAVQSLVA